MDLRKLKTLVDLVAESGISELEITEAEGRVRIVKAPPAPPPQTYNPPPMAPMIAVPGPATGNPGIAAAAEVAIPIARGNIVKSPMVGTLYRAPNPQSDPFIEIGSQVKIGDTLCIIEAMKLMNEIECDTSGEVTAVYVENGRPVQFGERLFAVRVSSV